MKFKPVHLILFCLAFFTKCLDKNIISISETSFEQDFKAHNNIFVLFYKTDDSNDVEKFETIFKEFKQANAEIKNKRMPIQFAIVDSTAYPSVSMSLGISIFPTLRFYVDSSYVLYTGAANSQDMISFLTLKVENPSREFFIPEDVEAFIENKEVLVFFGEPKRDNPKFQMFLKIARNNDDVLFAHCGMYECIEYYKIGWNEIIFFKKKSNQSFELKDPYTDFMIQQLINNNYTKVLRTLDKWEADFIFVRNNVGLVLFRDADNSDHIKYELMMMRVAKFFKGFIFFTLADMKSAYEKEVALITKINKENMPCAFIYDARLQDIYIYKLEGELTDDALYNFALDFGLGKLKQYRASEEIVKPEHQTFPIQKLVSKSFQQEVIDEKEKYSFIIFYGDDCTHCHKALTLFERTAKYVLEKNKNIKFYKINGDKNDVMGVDLQGYPYIKLYNPNKRYSSVDYPIASDRSIKRLAEFLIENIPGFDMSNINDKLDDDFEVEYDNLYDNSNDSEINLKEDM